MQKIYLLLLLTALICLGLQAFYYVSLPDQVASHFNGVGQPNGWMSKEANVLFSGFIVLMLTGVFAGVPLSLKKASWSSINTPNRQYWLTAEHIDEFMAIFAKNFAMIGVLTNVLLIFVFHRVYQFNVGVIDNLGKDIMLVLMVYVLCVMLMVLSLYLRLKKTP